MSISHGEPVTGGQLAGMLAVSYFIHNAILPIMQNQVLPADTVQRPSPATAPQSPQLSCSMIVSCEHGPHVSAEKA